MLSREWVWVCVRWVCVNARQGGSSMKWQLNTWRCAPDSTRACDIAHTRRWKAKSMRFARSFYCLLCVCCFRGLNTSVWLYECISNTNKLCRARLTKYQCIWIQWCLRVRDLHAWNGRLHVNIRTTSVPCFFFFFFWQFGWPWMVGARQFENSSNHFILNEIRCPNETCSQAFFVVFASKFLFRSFFFFCYHDSMIHCPWKNIPKANHT